MPSLVGCHLQVFANKQRNTYNDVQTCGKLCSDVILYNGLDMEADLHEVYFFVLIFIYPNFLAIHKDAVKQNNRFSAFDSLGQNQFRTSSLLAIIDRWLLVLQNAWFLKRLLFHYHKIVYCSISTLIKRTPLDVEHK